MKSLRSCIVNNSASRRKPERARSWARHGNSPSPFRYSLAQNSSPTAHSSSGISFWHRPPVSLECAESLAGKLSGDAIADLFQHVFNVAECSYGKGEGMFC